MSGWHYKTREKALELAEASKDPQAAAQFMIAAALFDIAEGIRDLGFGDTTGTHETPGVGEKLGMVLDEMHGTFEGIEISLDRIAEAIKGGEDG